MKSLVSIHKNAGDYLAVSRTTTDEKLIAMWLEGKSENTRAAYSLDIGLFFATIQKPIQAVMLEDLHAFARGLALAKVSSQARTRNAVKSLFSYAMSVGYIRMNPGAAWQTPKPPPDLAGRILTEEQVMTMLAREPDQRNHAILRLLYSSGVRVSELCSLTWHDVQPNAAIGGQITVLGKGNKRRSIPVSLNTYNEVLALRQEVGDDDPVFVSSYSDKPLDRSRVFRIVAEAGKRAGIKGVSPHWLRHAHASHALDHNAPIQLVKETLGHENIVTTNKYAHARPNTSSSTYLPV